MQEDDFAKEVERDEILEPAVKMYQCLKRTRCTVTLLVLGSDGDTALEVCPSVTTVAGRVL